MSRRRQFLLAERTREFQEELAADRAGNFGFVVREAVQDPEFMKMMERSEDDIRAGRVCPTRKWRNACTRKSDAELPWPREPLSS